MHWGCLVLSALQQCERDRKSEIRRKTECRLQASIDAANKEAAELRRRVRAELEVPSHAFQLEHGRVTEPAAMPPDEKSEGIEGQQRRKSTRRRRTVLRRRKKTEDRLKEAEAEKSKVRPEDLIIGNEELCFDDLETKNFDEQQSSNVPKRGTNMLHCSTCTDGPESHLYRLTVQLQVQFWHAKLSK